MCVFNKSSGESFSMNRLSLVLVYVLVIKNGGYQDWWLSRVVDIAELVAGCTIKTCVSIKNRSHTLIGGDRVELLDRR